MGKIKSLFSKNKEIILYLIFGVLTTLVSILSFWLLGLVIPSKFYLITNIISCIIAIVFAFITNKSFVFESKSWSKEQLKKEFPKFFGARAFGIGVEELGLWLLIRVCAIKGTEIFSFYLNGDLIAKIIMSVIVIILNYFFSKFLVFKKR